MPFESLVDLSSLPKDLFCPMPIQTAWKAVEKMADISSNALLSETEFPFLDAKPEVDQRQGKGRRHAGELLLQKRLAGQAFVLKQLVGQRALGKKRRARLLSETSDDMHLNVPYSMNRKNRWEMENAADCLRNRQVDENLSISAIDSFFTSSGLSADVLAFHQLDADGTVNSRQSNGSRGFALAELNSADNADKNLGIRYVMAKAHPMPKYQNPKSKTVSRTAKRAQMDVSVYSTDGEAPNDEEIPTVATEETLRMYRPRQNTYTLADFILDNSAAVATEGTNLPNDGFVQVEMPLATVEDDATLVETLPVELSGPGRSVDVEAKQLGVQSRADWLRQSEELAARSELRFRWLNAARVSFQVDGTAVLSANSSPLLILTIAHFGKTVRIQINRSAQTLIDDQQIEPQKMGTSLEAIIRSLFKATRIRPHSQQPANEQLGSLLCVAATPLTDYLLIENSTALENPIIADLENDAVIDENEEEIEEEEEEEDDDFEHIDMDQLVDPHFETKWIDSTLDESIISMKTLCEECGSTQTADIILLEECGHTLCAQCLESHIRPLVAEGSALNCPMEKCGHSIPLWILSSLIPLPLVHKAIRSRVETLAVSSNRTVFECPNGCGLGAVDCRNRFPQTECTQCSLSRCLQCGSQPHWPLDCRQWIQWQKKIADLKTGKLETDKSIAESAHQFVKIAMEANGRRVDTATQRAIAKDVRKLIGYKFERQFIEIRKSCLQMIELGYGSLFLSKHKEQRPANFAASKNVLSTLRSEYNALESCIRSSSSSNPNKIPEQIQKVRTLLHKAIAELNRP